MIFENLIKSAYDNQRTDCQNYTKLRTFIVNVLERKVKSVLWLVEVKIENKTQFLWASTHFGLSHFSE